MLEILDSTLREGELTSHVSFSLQQKIEIAKMLDDFGVDFIEAGMPIQSKSIKEAVKKIVEEKLNAKILGHARAMREDINAVIDCNCDWIGIFMGVNELSLNHKSHCSKEQAMEKIIDSIEYAKTHGLKVRYTPEDATRTNFQDLIAIVKRAEEAQVDRISIADTVGIATPTQMFQLISEIKTQTKTDLNAHCHNDFGLAVANSLAAYEAGAKLIDVAVNGLGERVGITPLAEVCLALHFLYKEKNKWKIELIPKISNKVEEYSNLKINHRTPLIGKNAFTHKAALHVKAIKENPECYEVFLPRLIGRKREFAKID